jgi:hypothetical protein
VRTKPSMDGDDGVHNRDNMHILCTYVQWISVSTLCGAYIFSPKTSLLGKLNPSRPLLCHQPRRVRLPHWVISSSPAIDAALRGYRDHALKQNKLNDSGGCGCASALVVIIWGIPTCRTPSPLSFPSRHSAGCSHHFASFFYT